MKYVQAFRMISLGIFWLFLNSCATSQPPIQTTPPDNESKAVKTSVIQKISFAEEENYTRIQIEGSESLESPFYKLLSDPLRIAIDVPNMDLKQMKEPLKIDNGTVGEVSTAQLDDKGRIEIGLKEMTNYNILKEGKILAIDIEKVKKIAEVGGEVKKEGEVIKEKEAPSPPPELKKEEAPAARPVETPAAPSETLSKAKKVLNLVIDQKKEFIALNFIADGKMGDYDAFKLDSPQRLVVDIWGVDTQYSKKAIPIQNRFIKKVRIGRHPDKLRLVFESSTPKLPSYQINRIHDKLIVAFGNVPQSLEPQIVLPQKAPERTAGLKAQVKSPVEFKQLDHKSRIIVSLTEEPQFESKKISKNVVSIDIKNAFLPKHLQRSLDVNEFGSAVKQIDPKNVKRGKENDVRILITLKEEMPYEITREGKTLFIDIEKPGKIAPKVEAVPERKKEEVETEVKKEEAKEEAKNDVKKEEPKQEPKQEEVVAEEVKKTEKPAPELKKSDKSSPPLGEKPVAQPEGIKKDVEEKVVGAEGLQEKTYTGRKLSLDFKDADIKNILRLIAEVSNFNIITGDDVTGKITMRLVDVPWDQALDIILQAKSLGMTKVGNVMRIAPLESLKKEIQAELESKRAKEKLEDLATDFIPVNYAQGKELLPQVKSLLSDRGDVKVDERTNILIIKDIARNIASAKNLVKTLDAKTPQVMIEARIVEANVTFQRELGISWGFMAHEGPDKKKELSVGGGTGGTSSLRTPIGTSSVDTRKLVDLPAAGGSVLEFLLTSDYGLKNLDVAISASEEQGDVKIISSPKIATLDNKEASVEQGLRIPYLKLTTEGTVTTDFIDANLKLTVTPHVTNDGHVRMSIKAKKDAPDDSITVEGVPSIDKKEAITEVMIRDGGVVAIAGIYTIDKSKTTDGVPLFSKIPILGWLFKRERKEDNRRDLLIFISPKIIKDQV